MIDYIDIQDIIKIAKDAGKAVMKIYNQDFGIEYKKDSSPLTIADKKANEIIVTSLNQLSINSFLQQNIPILSEEGRTVPYDERKNWEYFWLVDPLDGTKEFVNKNGEFTVNIALIENNNSVLGIIYAPAKSLLYFAKKNYGAFKIFSSSSSNRIIFDI